MNTKMTPYIAEGLLKINEEKNIALSRKPIKKPIRVMSEVEQYAVLVHQGLITFEQFLELCRDDLPPENRISAVYREKKVA